MNIISVYITVGSEVEAEYISRTLIEEKLAACSNSFPINSYYNWDSKLQNDKEIAVLLKSSSQLWDELQARISSLHSYDVPEIVGFPASHATGSYLSWVLQSVSAPPEGVD